MVLLKMSPESAPDNGWSWGGGSVVPDLSVVSRRSGRCVIDSGAFCVIVD